MHVMRKRRGFTLIELLIVVAIIAILALIAVPNFLEAQTRAKVSRMRADFRSLSTALEAYYVDYNSYVNRDNGDSPLGVYVQGLKQLTSPVAYITQVPYDGFGQYGDLAVNRRPMLELGTGDAATLEPSGPPDAINPKGCPSNTWMVRSTGPDRVDDTLINNYPRSFDRPAAEISGLIYDPTNGTVSKGDLYRTGGLRPSGPGFDVLWAGASK